MATNKNIIEEAYGIDTKKIGAWIARNATLIMIVSLVSFAFGYNKGQSIISLDCKYAKSIRVENEAFKCEKIL